MLADEGTTILKFYLHIDKDEQKERLQARLDEPHKNWKFSSGDLEERKHWDKYMAAYEYAINQSVIPWHIVPVDQRWYRDYVIAKTIVDQLETLNLSLPNGDEPA